MADPFGLYDGSSSNSLMEELGGMSDNTGYPTPHPGMHMQSPPGRNRMVMPPNDPSMIGMMPPPSPQQHGQPAYNSMGPMRQATDASKLQHYTEYGQFGMSGSPVNHMASSSGGGMQSQGVGNHGLMNSMQQQGGNSQSLAGRQQYGAMQQAPPMNPSHHHHMVRPEMASQSMYGVHNRMNNQGSRHPTSLQHAAPPQPPSMQMNQGQMWNNPSHPPPQNQYIQEQACMPSQYMDYSPNNANANANNANNMAMLGVQRLSHYSDQIAAAGQTASPHVGMVPQNIPPHMSPRPGNVQNAATHPNYPQNAQGMTAGGYHTNTMHPNQQPQAVRPPYGYPCDTNHRQMSNDPVMNSTGKLSHYAQQYGPSGTAQCQSYQQLAQQHSHNMNVADPAPPGGMGLFPGQQQPPPPPSVPNGSPHYRPIYPKMSMSPQRPTPPPPINSPMPPTSAHTPDRLPVPNTSPQPSQGSYRSSGTSLSPTVGGQSSLQQLEQMVLPHINNNASPNASAQSNPFHTVMASNTTPSPQMPVTNNTNAVMSPELTTPSSHFLQNNPNSPMESTTSRVMPAGSLGPMPSPVMSASSPNSIAMSSGASITPLGQQQQQQQQHPQSQQTSHSSITTSQDSYELQQMRKIQHELQQLYASPQTNQTQQKIFELQEQLCILQQPLPPGPQQPLPVPIPCNQPTSATQSPQPISQQMQSPCLQSLPPTSSSAVSVSVSASATSSQTNDIASQLGTSPPPPSYMLLPTQPQVNSESDQTSTVLIQQNDSSQVETTVPQPPTQISSSPVPSVSPFEQNTINTMSSVPMCASVAENDFGADGQMNNHVLLETNTGIPEIATLEPALVSSPQPVDCDSVTQPDGSEIPGNGKKKTKKNYKKKDPKEPKTPKKPKTPKIPKEPKATKEPKKSKRPKKPKEQKDNAADSSEGKDEVKDEDEAKKEGIEPEKPKPVKRGGANHSRGKGSKTPAKKRPPPKALLIFSKKKRKRTGSSDVSDLEVTPPPSPAPEDDSTHKRRSARNTKRKKYTDDIELEISEEDQLEMDIEKINQVSGADDQLKPTQFFINPNDEDSMVVEKIMSSKIVTKEVENGENVEAAEPVEVEEFYVKYKNFSYLHCDWKTQEGLEKGDRRVIMKIKRYKQKKLQSSNIFEFLEEEPFNPEYVEVDRVLDISETTDPQSGDVTKHYLVKWRGLSYEESTWELEEDVDKEKVEQFFRFRQPPTLKEDNRSKKRPKANEWKKLEESTMYKGANTLREYQLEGLNWLMFSWHNGQNCILADEMGLGKTIQSISFLCELCNYGFTGPFLVIAPLSTIANWQREFETWSDLNVIVYHGSCASRNMIQDYEMHYKDEKGKRIPDVYKFQVLITTFEIIITDCLELREIPWRCVIIDEAHRLKNKNCKLLEGLRLLNMEHRVLLSGTPLQNNVEELFSLLNFLEPAQFPSSEEFLKEFGDLKSETQVQKLQQLLKPMMLRRLKEDVEKSLAPKEETIIEVELTNIQKKYYRAILERNFNFLAKGSSSANVPNLMNTMMELRKCCIHPYLISGAEEQIQLENKLNRSDSCDGSLAAMIQSSGKLVLIDKLLPKLKVNGHRVLVFSQMVRCLDILEDYLIQRRYPYERIDGRVRGNMRQAAIDRFSKPDSDRFVFLLCTRAGGLGINLTAADTVIIFDSDWNPQNDLQAQARCHRIGQQKAVKVYRLICRNTYEREMFDKASLKLGLDKAVLQSMNTTGKDGIGPAQQMSKKEIEDLLRKGAYGAIMEDDNAADQFCEEDIDQILQGRTQVIQLESGVKGSTFAKASFVSSGNRTDIDIDDPEFWQKWAKRADIDMEELAAKNDLIVHEPRRRIQTRRFGNEDSVLELSELDSSDDDDSVSSTRPGRNLKKTRRSRRRRDDRDDDMDCYSHIGLWTRSECFKVEKGLLTFGWGRWTEIFTHGKFKRKLSEKDVEEISRAVLLYCLKYYKGDDKIKGFIWDLISPTADGQIKVHKNHSGLSAPVPRGRKSKKSKKDTKQSMNIFMDLYNWAKDPKYNPDFVLGDDGYKKHLERHANKVLLRVRLLYYVKQEVIGDLAFQVSRGIPASEMPIMSPCADGEIPVFWWDKEADKSLLVGVYKHGYERYNVMRLDPTLCFLTRCGPPDGAAVLAELNEQVIEDELKGDKDDLEDDYPLSPGSPSGDSTPKPTPIPVPAEAFSGEMGKLPFPTATDLNGRLRRIITGYQRNHKKQEMKLAQRAKRLEKREKIEAVIREREIKKRELQQRWSRREEADFYRTVSTFGVEFHRKQKCYDWSRFRALAHLDRKCDDTVTEYFKAFYAMCKKVCGKSLAKEEELLPYFVEPITEERARRCLEKIDLLNKIREETLHHPALDERLKLCQSTMDLPDWWIPTKHDKELLLGAAKHGLGRSDEHILRDPELSFLEVVKQYTKSKGIPEESEQMKVLLGLNDKNERLSTEEESNDMVVDLHQEPGIEIKQVAKEEHAEETSVIVAKLPVVTTPSEIVNKVEDITPKAEIKQEQEEVETKSEIKLEPDLEPKDETNLTPSEESSELKPEIKTEETTESVIKSDTASSAAVADDEENKQELSKEIASTTSTDETAPDDKSEEKPIIEENQAESKEQTPKTETPEELTETNAETNAESNKSEHSKSEANETETENISDVKPSIEKVEVAPEKLPKSEDVENDSIDPAQTYHNPVRWPKDRVLQIRLENICHCVEKNEWPPIRLYGMSHSMSPSIGESESTPHGTPDQTPRKDDMTRDSSSPMIDHVAAMETKPLLLDAGDILYPRRRRRRRKLEIEAERGIEKAKLRALLHQSLHHTALDLKSHSSKHDSRTRSMIQSGMSVVPPPAHQHTSTRMTYIGSLDLSLKVPPNDGDAPSPMDLSSHLKSSKSNAPEMELQSGGCSAANSNLSASSASDRLVLDLQMRKRRRQEEELEKLKQMKTKEESGRRRQRKKLDDIVGTLSAQIGAPQNLAKSNTTDATKMSMSKFSDGSAMKTAASSLTESFLNKDLAKWLSSHPGITIEKPNITRPDFHRVMDAESMIDKHNTASAQAGLEIFKLNRKRRRPRVDPSKLDFDKLTGNENVSVVNRITGKKITGSKAPPLKHLATWLKQNPMFDVDSKWSHLVKDKAHMPQEVKKRASSHSEKRSKYSSSASSLLSTSAATTTTNSLASSFPSLTGLGSLSGLSGAGLYPGFAGLKLPSLNDHGKSNAATPPHMFLPFGGLSNLNLTNPLFANIANFGFPLPVTTSLSSSIDSKSNDNKDKKHKTSSGSSLTSTTTTSSLSTSSAANPTGSPSLPFLFPAPGLLYNPLGLGNFTLPANLPTSFASLAQTSLLNGMGGNQNVLANGLLNQEIESDDDSLKSLMGHHDDDEDLPDDEADSKEIMEKESKEGLKKSTNTEKSRKAAATSFSGTTTSLSSSPAPMSLLVNRKTSSEDKSNSNREENSSEENTKSTKSNSNQ